MNVLVDTSVWVAHFRDRNLALTRLLEADRVMQHPFVRAELACGTPPAREATLAAIELLQPCQLASLQDVMDFVEREKLFGLGCGVIDLSLLASTLITPAARLWTLDKRLAALAERFNAAYSPA